MKVFISTISDLEQLVSNSPAVRFLPSHDEIVLELSGMSLEEQKGWANRLNRYYNTCGCPQGSAAILLTMLVYIAFIILRPSGFHLSWFDLGIGVILFLVSGAVGKALGILAGSIMFRRTTKMLSREMMSDRDLEQNEQPL